MDEKQSLLHASPAWAETPRRHTPTRRFRVAALLVGVLIVSCLMNARFFGFQHRGGAAPTEPHADDIDDLNPWDSITPSTELEWHPCYTAINPLFRCARFTVPMDYHRAADAATPSPDVHIALTLLLPLHWNSPSPNASVSSPEPKPKKQPLIINPGGPGGSGVLAALALGPGLQQIVGVDRPVLGFDPRGVQFTRPLADCWATPPPPSCQKPDSNSATTTTGDWTRTHTSGTWTSTRTSTHSSENTGCAENPYAGLAHRLSWDGMTAVFGGVNESDAALRHIDAGHRAVNDLCRARDGRLGGDSGLAFGRTEDVARDMLEIVDAWERFLDDGGTHRVDGVDAAEDGGMDGGEQDGDDGREEELKGKLVYWGFSYGTYLGATFARLFPERVGRVLLDGVVDAELYETPVWEESLVDADKVLARFFSYCAQAGKRCGLYRAGDEAKDVQRRYEAVMERLETDPVTFTHPDHFFPVLVRANVIKMLVFTTLYSPVTGFPGLAALLNFIHEGRYDLLSALFLDGELLCLMTGNPMVLNLVTDAQRATMCSDKTYPVNLTLAQVAEMYQSLASTSQFADIWMNVMLKCNGWDISSQSSHRHPSPSPHKPWPASTSLVSDQIDTAFPILFLSSTYDPVTPLRAAVKMAGKFKDAGLLEQESLGHCTVATVSRCTARAVREYVVSGKVPPPPKAMDGVAFTGEWMRCAADEYPWSAGADQLAAETVEERQMIEGWRVLQQGMARMQRWGVGDQKELDVDAVMALASRR